MNKRVIELTCGDPKTNQQTASKVDCTITINNVSKEPSKVKLLDEGTDVYLSDAPEEQQSPSSSSLKLTPVQQLQAKQNLKLGKVRSASNYGMKVQRDVKRTDVENLPIATEGFVQTSVRATITSDEVVSSIEVKDVLLAAQQRILRENDTLLLHNLLDNSQKIILHLDDLKHLIGTVIRLVDSEFVDTDVKVLVYENDIEVGCCGCKKSTLVNPFNEISAIIVGKQDLKVHQFEAYTAIVDQLNISLTKVYSKATDKSINVTEETVVETA